MAEGNLSDRVEMLERTLELLERLPDRVTGVELQMLHLCEEVRVGFSALRAEIRAGDEQTRTELRQEMRDLNQETRTHMLVLHEEVLSRIATIGEAFAPRRDRAARPRKTRKT